MTSQKWSQNTARHLSGFVSQVSPRAMRIKVIIGEPGEATAPMAAPAAQNEDEATRRALANPEVQRFQEVFDGRIYKVRNLKE